MGVGILPCVSGLRREALRSLTCYAFQATTDNRTARRRVLLTSNGGRRNDTVCC